MSGCVWRMKCALVCLSGARDLAVDHTPDLSRVVVLEFRGQGAVRKILKTNLSRKPKDGARADGGGAAVGRGRVWATVHHRVTDFNASRIAVENQAAGFCFEQTNQILI